MPRFVLFFLAFVLTGSAYSQSLTLFGLPLKGVGRDAVRSAAVAAGAFLQRSTKSTDVYNVEKIGLPGATKLELVYIGDQFVLAQYSFPKSQQDTDEKLRKMLASKYGLPKGELRRPWEKFDFTDEFVRDGKYRWSFDGAMELVYTKEFFGNRFLTYIDKENKAALDAMMKQLNDRSAIKSAEQSDNVF